MKTESKSEHSYNEVRVIYIAAKRVVASLRDDFIKAGADVNPEAPHQIHIGERLASRLSRQKQFQFFEEQRATVYFFSDAIAAVRELPRIEADFVIVDERKRTPSRGVRKPPPVIESRDVVLEGAPPDEVKPSEDGIRHERVDTTPDIIEFEEFQHALVSFTPKNFHYPSRRILVVIAESPKELNRAFKLGLANVRAVITDPSSSIELFLFATRELEEFRRNRKKTSLCLAGGGLEGYIYSLGVLSALDDCFEQKTTSNFDIYTGVSSGAILATTLAAEITTGDLIKQIYRREGRLEALSLGMVFDFATTEMLKRLVTFVRSFSSFDPSQVIAQLRQLVPLGMFRGDKMRAFVDRQLRRLGVRDSISALPKPCFVTATDLDTGETVVFGEKPWQDVRISQAVRASTAVPPFFLPERINGHWFTDGQLKTSYNFDSAIRRGAGLIVLVDPMVAYSTNSPGVAMKHGGYFVAVQALKSLVESRSNSMLVHAMDLNPDVDFVVFRPTDEVMEAMAGSPMHYRIRTELCELGYRGTILQILSEYGAMSHKFAKHGFKLKTPEEIKALLKV